MAAAASITGTARGTMHGSWRPWTSSGASAFCERDTLSWRWAMEAVGFTDIRLYGDKKLSPPDPHAVRWFLAARKPLTEEAPPTVGERITEVPQA